MVTIDKRLTHKEMEHLQRFIGQMMISVKHDEFHFVNASSQVVGLETEGGMTFLYSFTEPLDYYGSIEDVAVWELSDVEYKFIKEKNFMSSPVNERIKEIQVIQEHQRLFEGGRQTYDVWVTRGIIFDFGEHQYSFEKPVWFSTDIYIRKGYDLIGKFASTNQFINDDWAEGCSAMCEREVVVIK